MGNIFIRVITKRDWQFIYIRQSLLSLNEEKPN
jgi:hypothetical protein